MARHTMMPPRKQKTPHGDVTLTSRWKRNEYMLVASGGLLAVQWMFPRLTTMPERHGVQFRHVFRPSPAAVTVERVLRQICAAWQAHWDERLQDDAERSGNAPSGHGTDQVHAIRTVGQLFAHVHQDRSQRIAKISISRERYKLNLWESSLGSESLLLDLTPVRLGEALKRISERTSVPTANASFALVKTYFTWAFNMGIMPDQRYRTVRCLRQPPENRHHRAWWSAREVELALQCAAQDPHQPTATLLVALGCFLGLRVEEMVMLRWQDLSLDMVDPATHEPQPVCHITPHSGWTPKDGEARDIPISTPLLKILMEHRKAEGYLLETDRAPRQAPRSGKGWNYRYNPRKTWLRISRSIEAAGGKPITMYGMRHSFASNMLIARVSDVKVARWLGHADTRMVHRHYGHLLSYDADINSVRFPRAALDVPAGEQ